MLWLVLYAPILWAGYPDTVFHAGLRIVLDIKSTGHAAAVANGFYAGDYVRVQFHISEGQSGRPLSGVYPAAWLDFADGETSESGRAPEDCVLRVRGHLEGGFFPAVAAEADLNIYHIAVLNDDASISVIDPLFSFGGSRLLTNITLPAPASDWVYAESRNIIFVAVPGAKLMCAVDTETWEAVYSPELPDAPQLVALQPDEHYVWLAGANSISALRTDNLRPVAHLYLGENITALAAGPDNRWVYALGDTTLWQIDVRNLRVQGRCRLESRGVALAYSAAARKVYVACSEGAILAVNSENLAIRERVQTEAGICAFMFSPGGRYGFVLNRKHNKVAILDPAENTIIQEGYLERSPAALAFSRDMAYIAHDSSEAVLMIALQQVGVRSEPLQVVDFPGGYHPVGAVGLPGAAANMVQAPGAAAMLIAHRRDHAVYYYMEGMAAPAGSFADYGHAPRAVLAIDRSLRQAAPGVYESTLRLERSGRYTLAFFLDAPRVVHCFELEAAARTEDPEEDSRIRIQALPDPHRSYEAQDTLQLRFALYTAAGEAVRDAEDVRLLAFLVPGHWQKRLVARHEGDGIYGARLVAPYAGLYYIYLSSKSLGIEVNNPWYQSLIVLDAPVKD